MPDHDDGSPSFSLSANGLFHCWGCGARGNYTRLLHDIVGYSWKKSSETVGYLNLRKNWTAKKKSAVPEPKRTISAAVLGLYDTDWQHAQALWQAHRDEGRRPPWALVFEKGFTHKTLAHFQAGYDKEDQRITIPVWTEDKRLLGLLGRACRKGEFKYVPYQNFRYAEHVYNLDASTRGEMVVLVEGAFDVWMLWQWKIPLTAIATMTSHISAEQVVQIAEKHRHVAVFYDNDMAGWKGSAQAAKALMKCGVHVDVVQTARGVANIKDMDGRSFMRQYERRTPYPCVIGDVNSPHNKAIVPSSRRAFRQGVKPWER